MKSNPVVIDTNVLAVANDPKEVGLECYKACVEELERLKRRKCVVVLDTDEHILSEYKRYCNYEGGPGLGDAFFRYMYQQGFHQEHQVEIHPIPKQRSQIRPKRRWKEFPEDPALSGFDPSDQKFVAVALTHPVRPPILHATDKGWLKYRAALLANKVRIKSLCPHLPQFQQP